RLLADASWAHQATQPARLDPFPPTDQRGNIDSQPHPSHRPQRTDDVTGSDAALAGPPRIVLHTLLQDAEVPLPRLGHHFGVDEEIGSLEIDRFQHLAAEKLERAVDIPDARPEDGADQPVIDPGEETTQHRVVPVDPKADGDV